MAEEVFDYDHFNMIVEYVLKIKNRIYAIEEIRNDLIESAIKEDRNLDEFEVCFIDFLVKLKNEENEKLDIFYKHVRAEEADK